MAALPSAMNTRHSPPALILQAAPSTSQRRSPPSAKACTIARSARFAAPRATPPRRPVPGCAARRTARTTAGRGHRGRHRRVPAGHAAPGSSRHWCRRGRPDRRRTPTPPPTCAAPGERTVERTALRNGRRPKLLSTPAGDAEVGTRSCAPARSSLRCSSRTRTWAQAVNGASIWPNGRCLQADGRHRPRLGDELHRLAGAGDRRVQAAGASGRRPLCASPPRPARRPTPCRSRRRLVLASGVMSVCPSGRDAHGEPGHGRGRSDRDRTATMCCAQPPSVVAGPSRPTSAA